MLPEMETNDAGPVVHIGFHKTASTWLQDVLFPALVGVAWVGTSGVGWELLRNVANAVERDVVPGTLRRFAAETAERAGVPALLSYEGLSGALWSAEDIGPRSARRLHSALPDARIVVVVREQGSMLRSVYWQYVLEGGVLGLGGFLGQTDDSPSAFDLAHIEYDRVVKSYVDAFGAGRVLVLPHELLRLDAPRFLTALLDFTGASLEDAIDVDTLLETVSHQSPGSFAIDAVRHWNSLFRASQLHRQPKVLDLGAGVKAARRVAAVGDRFARQFRATGTLHHSQETIGRVRFHYKESNARLQEYTRYDLGGLGYVC